MMKQKELTLHIISHTHWDREWFLNSPYTREWLIPFFDSLFRMMEKEPRYIFILDGQTIMIEDYFDELEKVGREVQEYREKIIKYTKEKRLILGPYYLQPDWQLISDESLIRNLLIGIKMADQLGGSMKTGWLLDNFGQISQTAQIHAGFGIDALYVWRGVDIPPAEVQTEFMWQSPDGSRVLSIYLLDSYRNAMRLSDHLDILTKRVDTVINRISPFGATDNVLFMNGYDQEMVPDDIVSCIRYLKTHGYKVKQTTPAGYVEAIMEAKPSLKVHEGYFYSGRYISVFPGILSSRMHLKLSNDRISRLIEGGVEPLSVFSWLIGGSYPGKEIEGLWKTLLKNHPHDSICGVSIDDVHLDMEERFEGLEVDGSRLLHDQLREIVSRINTAGNKQAETVYLVFNTSLQKKSVMVKISEVPEGLKIVDVNNEDIVWQHNGEGETEILIPELPPLGFKNIYLTKKETVDTRSISPKEQQVRIHQDDMVMENGFLKVKVLEDGSIDILDKTNDILYQGIGVFEEAADAGDTYNYSAPLNDRIILSTGKKANVEWIDRGPLFSTIKISIEMEVPERIDESRDNRSKETRTLPVISYVRLEASSALLKIKTSVKNTVKDHRLRVLFPTNIETDFSYPGTQFDVVEHEISPAPYHDEEIPEHLRRVLIGAREASPVTIFPQREFVDLHDNRRGLAVLNRGLPAYEVLCENNTIALTLFRSIDWLARGDLRSRTGDAGPEIFTPDAQLLREMDFEYAVYPHNGDWQEGRVPQVAADFNADTLVIQGEIHDGDLEEGAGILELISERDLLKVTAVKVSEAGDSVIIRFFNPSKEWVQGQIRSGLEIITAAYTNFSEEKTEDIPVDDDHNIRIEAGPKKILTVKLTLKRHEIVSRALDLIRVVPQDRGRIHKEFSKYPPVPFIEEKDILLDQQRYSKLIDKLEASKEELEVLFETKEREGDSPDLQAKMQKVKGDISTYYRISLEAQISLQYAENRLDNLQPDNTSPRRQSPEMKETLRELGLEFNMARIRKRTDDYLIECYR